MKMELDLGGQRHRLEGETGHAVLAIGLVVAPDRPPFVSARVAGELDGAPIVFGNPLEFQNGEVCINLDIVEL